MKLEAEGQAVFDGQVQISEAKLDDLGRALGSASAAETSTLVPLFGPTVAGETQFVDVLGLDLAKALLGGLAYDWVRPFIVGEIVTTKVFIDKVFDKGTNRFGIVVAEFRDSSDALVQRQTATFIEAGAS